MMKSYQNRDEVVMVEACGRVQTPEGGETAWVPLAQRTIPLRCRL